VIFGPSRATLTARIRQLEATLLEECDARRLLAAEQKALREDLITERGKCAGLVTVLQRTVAAAQIEQRVNEALIRQLERVTGQSVKVAVVLTGGSLNAH
jgi:hypothetical protein